MENESDRLLPFFTYYGGKFRAAPKYPVAMHGTIIEPFAGSAGYSLRTPLYDVKLFDLDDNIVQTWDYLIHVSETEILDLPDLAVGQSVDDLTVCDEAKLLIGWWLNKGSAQPKRKPSSFMLKYPEGGPYWGPRVRARIAPQLQYIRHWQVAKADYGTLDNERATWFIDPPYVNAGHHYRHGSTGIDYDHLAQWCLAREGQVIVCEADDADWLPFEPLTVIDGTEGRQKQSRARTEVMWRRDYDDTTSRCPDCGLLHDRRVCIAGAWQCDCCTAIEAA